MILLEGYASILEITNVRLTDLSYLAQSQLETRIAGGRAWILLPFCLGSQLVFFPCPFVSSYSTAAPYKLCVCSDSDFGLVRGELCYRTQ